MSITKKILFPDNRAVSIQFETIKDQKTIANINDTKLTAKDVYLKLFLVDESKLPKNYSKQEIIDRITQINQDMQALQIKFGEFESVTVRNAVYDVRGKFVGFEIDGEMSVKYYLEKQKELSEAALPTFKKISELSEIVNPTLRKERNYEAQMNHALKDIRDLQNSIFSIVSTLPTIYFFVIYLINFVKKETLRKTSEKPLSDSSSFFWKQQTDPAKSSPSKDRLNIDEAPPAYSKEVPKGHVRVDEDPPPAYSELKI